MKLVMTLLVRDEEDSLREHLDYYPNAGVDVIVATDHGSPDGTTEILHSTRETGCISCVRASDSGGNSFGRDECLGWPVSRVGADWVSVGDADEGHSRKALRCLKRHLARVVYRTRRAIEEEKMTSTNPPELVPALT